jgi:hypothetical protein
LQPMEPVEPRIVSDFRSGAICGLIEGTAMPLLIVPSTK